MRPKPVKRTVTSTENTEVFGVNLRAAMIKNIGGYDILIDFDEPISENSYVLEPGETLNLDFPFISMSYKTATNSSTLHIIKVWQ